MVPLAQGGGVPSPPGAPSSRTFPDVCQFPAAPPSHMSHHMRSGCSAFPHRPPPWPWSPTKAPHPSPPLLPAQLLTALLSRPPTPSPVSPTWVSVSVSEPKGKARPVWSVWEALGVVGGTGEGAQRTSRSHDPAPSPASRRT